MSKRWPQSGQTKATTSPGRKPSSSGTEVSLPAAAPHSTQVMVSGASMASSVGRPGGSRRGSEATYTPGVLPVLVLRHDDDAGPGYLGDALAAAGLEIVVVEPEAGEPLPGLSGWSAVVALGGSMGAYEEGAYPWLAAEKRLLAGAVAAQVPTLGICLGCQVLADALGGRAYLGTGREVGLLSLELTASGRADPVVRHLDAPVAVSHGDTWDLPPGATLLAQSNRYRHAFRRGSALGLQPHPEVSPEPFARWTRSKPADEMARDGIDPEAAIAAVRAGAEAQRAMAARLFGAWVAEVSSRESAHQ